MEECEGAYQARLLGRGRLSMQQRLDMVHLQHTSSTTTLISMPGIQRDLADEHQDTRKTVCGSFI